MKQALAGAEAASASIILPCWNALWHTRRCVESLGKWTTYPYEMIVIDNGSTDGTGRFLAELRAKALRGRLGKSLRGCRVIANESNRGFAKAINQGMQAARGRHIVWLNNDVVVTPGWLDRLVGHAESSSDIAAVGPCANTMAVVRGDWRRGRVGAKMLPFFAEAWAARHEGERAEAEVLYGFCFLVKRSAVKRAGLLDETFSPACYEDDDYCVRLRWLGYKLVVAKDVFVYHRGHASFRANRMSYRRQLSRNLVLFKTKWEPILGPLRRRAFSLLPPPPSI